MLLRLKDIQLAMQDKWLQLYWPDDGKWWPAQVTEVDTKAHRAKLLYETGKIRSQTNIFHVTCTVKTMQGKEQDCKLA